MACHNFLVKSVYLLIDEATELKNANGFVIALRHRTSAQARAHLK